MFNIFNKSIVAPAQVANLYLPILIPRDETFDAS